jgi:beta-1,4-mannosyltransferase
MVDTARRTTVLAWPARRTAEQNSFNARLSDATEGDSFVVDEFSIKASVLADFDVLHIHWPDALLKHVSMPKQAIRMAALTCVLFWVRAVRRIPIVWTVHNLAPHNGAAPWAVWWLRAVLSALVDHQVHLTRATANELKKVSPRLARQPATVIPHGSYQDELRSGVSRQAVRERLNLSERHFVIGFVGTVTPYKGAEQLARVFAGWPAPQARLIVAGNCADAGIRAVIEDAAARDDRIWTRFGWLGQEEMAELLGVSNVVAFPYTQVLNSGSVMMALTAGRPVLAPRLGSLSEIQQAVGPAWLQLYDGELSADVLQHCSEQPIPSGMPDLDAFSWPAIGQAHRSCYLGLLEK